MQLGCPALCCISVTVRERKDESQQGGTYLHEVDTSSLFHKEQIKRDSRLTQRCTRLRVSAGAIAQIAWHLSSFPSPVHSPRTVMQVIWKCCPGKARLFHYQHMEPMGLIPDGDITVQRLCLSLPPSTETEVITALWAGVPACGQWMCGHKTRQRVLIILGTVSWCPSSWSPSCLVKLKNKIMDQKS